ncbi:MAG: riboflavin synthase [Planctomycetota bacterium]
MFTGIVEHVARVARIAARGEAYRFTLDLGPVVEGLRIGDSVAVDGACLTVVALRGAQADFDVIRETVERTAFAALREGDGVNVERPMRADGRFHGHLVAGHVDAPGRIVVKREEPGQTWLTVETRPELVAFMVEKGSVTLSGVSLTLTEVAGPRFSVALIPHTLAVTTLGRRREGDLLNVEVDQLAKMVHRLIAPYLPGARSGLDLDALGGPR